MTAVFPILAAVAAYLLGSLSFAVIVTRVMGLSDPRTYGSKNPGATNVLRSGSKAAAIVTLLLGGMKAWPPGAWVILLEFRGVPAGGRREAESTGRHAFPDERTVLAGSDVVLVVGSRSMEEFRPGNGATVGVDDAAGYSEAGTHRGGQRAGPELGGGIGGHGSGRGETRAEIERALALPSDTRMGTVMGASRIATACVAVGGPEHLFPLTVTARTGVQLDTGGSNFDTVLYVRPRCESATGQVAAHH